MVKVNSTGDFEVSFINEHFTGVSFEKEYCLGFFDGNDEQLEAILQRFLAINPTSFVMVERHSKDNNNKQFTQTGKLNVNVNICYLF
jgi:hypothetical protein